MIRLRAFRATDDPETCEKFLEGHTRVLTSVGVTKVTSNKAEWVDWDCVFPIVVEDTETGEVLGGARIHAHDGLHPLPVEEATSYMDDNVVPYIANMAQKGVGEVCGLWNSMKVAGMGFGSIYLSRAAIALVEQIGLNGLTALCAPYTVKPAKMFGYKTIHEIGNDGTFYYPKLDLLATFMAMHDTTSLPDAYSGERNKVFDLRKQRNVVVEEQSRKGEITMEYMLDLKIKDQTQFHIKK